MPSFLRNIGENNHVFAPTLNDGDQVSSGSESGDSRSTASGVGSLNKHPARLDTAELEMKRRSTQSSIAPTTTHRSVTADLTATSQAINNEEQDTAAVSSLRRMSHATKAFSISKAQDIRRLSRALTASFYHAPSRETGFGPTTSNDAERILASGISQTDVDDFLHKADTHALLRNSSVRPSPVNQERIALETPNTITLRKASDAYFFVIGPKDERVGTKFDDFPTTVRPKAQSQDPSATLLDFRSKRVCEPRKSMWYNLPLLSEQDDPGVPGPPTSEPPTTEPDETRPRPSLPTIQPRSLPSEPAITFSSVQRTTPTCLLDPPTRKNSIFTASKGSRQTSTVHIHSRTSIHEIIWAEDQNANTSSSSSRESASPTQRTSRQPSVVTGNIAAKAGPRSQPASPGSVKDLARVASPELPIFDWSWNAPSLPQHQMLDEPVVCSPIDEIPSKPPKQKWRQSKSKDSSVESFPPLLERNNTTEWQRAPLVDINEPLKEKGRWLPVLGSTEAEERSEEVPGMKGLDGENEDDRDGGEEADDEGNDGDEHSIGKKARRASFHPYAESRMGKEGTVGSSLGISGRKRVSWSRV